MARLDRSEPAQKPAPRPEPTQQPTSAGSRPRPAPIITDYASL